MKPLGYLLVLPLKESKTRLNQQILNDHLVQHILSLYRLITTEEDYLGTAETSSNQQCPLHHSL